MTDKSLERHRNFAFVRQRGLCFYCGLPMRPNDSVRQCEVPPDVMRLGPQFLATAEHLTPRSEGGPTSRTNIVAAHALCNRRRHRSKNPPTPEQYRYRVRRRVEQKKWFDARSRQLLENVRGAFRPNQNYVLESIGLNGAPLNDTGSNEYT